MTDWQKIETAPKDGTPILVFDPLVPLRPVCEAIMLSDGTYKDPTYSEWFSDTKATHWQPLPLPPISEGE